MRSPQGKLAYRYVGKAAFDRVMVYFRDVLGAEIVWAFAAFSAKVAAVRVCDGPLLLLADHRPAPSCMTVLAVENLEATVGDLKRRGWRSEGEPFEIPNGPCYRFTDPSGNPLALFQDLRPKAMEIAFADKDNPKAIRM